MAEGSSKREREGGDLEGDGGRYKRRRSSRSPEDRHPQRHRSSRRSRSRDRRVSPSSGVDRRHRRSRSLERKQDASPRRSRSRDRKEGYRSSRHGDRQRRRSRDRRDSRQSARSRSRSASPSPSRDSLESDRGLKKADDLPDNEALNNSKEPTNEDASVKKAKKVEPLSLEVLKKRKEDALQQSKPVFLTKEQRQQIALKKREEETAERMRRIEEERKFLSSQKSQEEKDRQERDRERREQREEEAKNRERERLEKQATREREKELDSIKEQYLGTKKLKKRVVKPSEKFRFSFDWENTEDTSRDMNPIYQNPHEAQLLFGRGFRAGMDRREQKKLAAKNEKDLRAEIRATKGLEERPEEVKAQKLKEEAANAYDAFDMRVDRHWSEKKLEDMSERDWRIFREDFNIAYKGTRLPRPMRNWEEGELSQELLKAVYKVGYKKPSPIQMAAIPLGLQQRDVIGIAETGSGKTAAFVLPMLTYISKLPKMNEENEAEGPYAVVMAPTRELAQQIEEETVKFAQYLNIHVVSIVGGQSIEEQGFKLRQGCEIVIATPGRLLDCLQRRYAVLNQCNYVVLDEADRMIDMGFEQQVIGVLDAMPSSNLKPENDEELDEKKIYRTTYMFSATMPPAVERLARKYLRNPVVVTIGTAGKATDLITQHVMMVRDGEKLDRLQRLLADLGDKTAIVFVNMRKTADSLARQLDKLGYRVTTLHGGKTQEQREISLEGFRNKRFNCLVATDVAGRGIDIQDVAHVINYDMPASIEMYTHRIGRTGRAGKTGVATTFLTLNDTDVFYDLKQMLTQSNSTVPPELARHEASKFKPGTIPDRPPRRNETLYAH